MHQQSSTFDKNAQDISLEENNDVSSEHAIASDSGHDTLSVNDVDNLSGVVPQSFVADDSSDKELNSIYESTRNRISGYVLGVSILIFTLVSMVVDYFQKHYSLEFPLITLCGISILCLVWLKDKKRNPMVPLMVMGSALTALGLYLLLCDGPPDGSSMIWVAIFPSTLVLCMGVRYGAMAFTVLYAGMVAVFYTPLSELAVVQFTDSTKIRLLLASFGSFGFVWLVEYARLKTNTALHLAAYNIEQTSLTDALTGLGNRRDFDRSLKWTMARSERSQATFALVLLDIDHFKRVNDTYGHAVGDDVLRHIAREVETQIRTADRLFRWGGEEFTIIMPSTDMHKAVAGAERVRKHIEKTPFILGNEKIYLTVSLGIYSGMETLDPNYPLHVADQCLYRAKSTGRNKVVGGL